MGMDLTSHWDHYWRGGVVAFALPNPTVLPHEKYITLYEDITFQFRDPIMTHSILNSLSILEEPSEPSPVSIVGSTFDVDALDRSYEVVAAYGGTVVVSYSHVTSNEELTYEAYVGFIETLSW